MSDHSDDNLIDAPSLKEFIESQKQSNFYCTLACWHLINRIQGYIDEQIAENKIRLDSDNKPCNDRDLSIVSYPYISG